MSKLPVFLGLVAALSIAAPAQAGVTVKNDWGGPPTWGFAFHPDRAITLSPSFVIGITAPGLAGTGLSKHVGPSTGAVIGGAESGSFVAGRPGPNTITWQWNGLYSATWPASVTISYFTQSAPGGVSAPLGGAFYKSPGGLEYWMTVAPDTMVGVVPEPMTLAAMSAGLVVAVFARPRRTR
jgi:hypothetical protein